MKQISIIRSNIGTLLVMVLTLIPFFYWIFLKLPSLNFISYVSLLTYIGQITALLGMALFSVTLILSGRFKFMESYFGGLDKLYTIHHVSGIISFILLLVHPLVLAYALVPTSVSRAATFLLPSSNLALNLGIAAYVGLIAVMIVTMFAAYRYQFLKFIHSFFGAILFFGALHSFIIPSDLSRNQTLKYYMIGLAVLGISVYLYRSVLGRLMVRKYKYEIVSCNLLTKDIIEFVLKPLSKKMIFESGQFIFISFPKSELRSEQHPFSISSATYDTNLRITVKALGDYTSRMKFLKPGLEAQVEGPYGGFSYLRARKKDQIWIAGGVGITPFLSMARSLIKSSSRDYNIDLYYSTVKKDEMVFINELNTIAEDYKNLRVIPFCTSESGFLSADHVNQNSNGLQGKEIFLCGPPSMMQALRNQFKKYKISRSLIHFENFKLL